MSKSNPNQEDLFGIYAEKDLTTSEKIQELYLKATACRACPNWKTRKKNLDKIAMWDGTVENPDLFLISEGPGYYETKSGKPFLGPSGKLLNEILVKVGTSRDRCFLTNVTLCEPLGSERNFPVSVLNACKEHWVEMIKIVNPKLIVPLGQIAMKSMFPTKAGSKTMRELDGTRWKFLDIDVIPTYHPAFFLKGTPHIRAKKMKDGMGTWSIIKKELGKK